MSSQKIVDKIRNLLELAEDGKNDEESQTALLMAQKLMLKYRLTQQDIVETTSQEVIVKSLSKYKKIFWWEKILATIIADNFRVLHYLQSNKLPHQKTTQHKIMLMGLEEDVLLAYETYHFATKAMKYYMKHHLDAEANGEIERKELRKSYMQGFMDGLADKFSQQKEQLQKENEAYALVVKVPDSVQEKFKQQVTGKVTFVPPRSNKSIASYHEGFNKGKKFNLADRTLGHSQDEN